MVGGATYTYVYWLPKQWYKGNDPNLLANAAAAVAAKIPLAEGTADPLPRLIPKYGFP